MITSTYRFRSSKCTEKSSRVDYGEVMEEPGMKQMKEVGNRVREIRKSKGMSQEDICLMVGMGSSTMTMIERGSDAIPLRRLFQIAQILDVPIWRFFKDEEKV